MARSLHPDDAAAARAWVEPLLAKLKADQSCEVISDLEPLHTRLQNPPPAAPAGERAPDPKLVETLERELRYLQTHRERLDYGTARARGEPLGSGAMESICRQYQCRFKRPGQFWSQTGDETLLCLEAFFPHARPLDPSKN